MKIIVGICFFQDPEEASEDNDYDEDDLLFTYIMNRAEKRTLLWEYFWNQMTAPKLDSLRMFCHVG